MLFPTHQSNYVEDEESNSHTFAEEIAAIDWATKEMIYVINLEDAGGKEHYFSTAGNLIALSDQSTEEPQLFKTYKQVNKQLDILLEKYPKTCRLYSVEHREFELRRKLVMADKNRPD